jgi:hypothetical protein
MPKILTRSNSAPLPVRCTGRVATACGLTETGCFDCLHNDLIWSCPHGTGQTLTDLFTTQCGSKRVSSQSLPKTGILPVSAGDFRQILALVALFLNPEISRKAQESLYFAGFLWPRCILSYVEGVAGWGGSSHITPKMTNRSITCIDVKRANTAKNTAYFGGFALLGPGAAKPR